ncbi:MAG: MarR family transcriptional regulator [Clostridiales bacterium]|nr:MarR family transcriptional regulator [Clostridiales bacterium]
MEFEEIARELFRCTTVFQRGPRRKMNEISQGEMAMLLQLIHTDAPATPTALSNCFHLSTARVTNILNSLERKAYVERTRDGTDRRKVIVRVTEAGKDYAAERYQEAIDDLKGLLTALGEEDAREYLRLMKKISTLIQEHEAQSLCSCARGVGSAHDPPDPAPPAPEA